MDYTKLEPGLYIQHGANIKRLGESNDPLLSALMGHYYNEPERLAAAVGWVFIALNKRRTQMKELLRYGQWVDSGGNELEAIPFVFNERQDFPRIDTALQLTSNAYLFKQRRGRRLIGLRFLDPATINPDPNSAEAIPGGVRYNRYWRTDPIDHTSTAIDASDIIHFILPGMREAEATPSAAFATKLAANIVLGMGELFSTLYQNNALPVMLVEVPDGTSDQDKAELQTRFWRLFNKWRGTKEHQTIGVREGVKVTKLSIDPESLDAIPLEDQRIKEILLAHDIPPESVMESANYAVSQDRRRELVGNIGQRIEDIVEVLANDPDLRAARVEYTVDIEQHWAMKRDEADAALAVARYYQVGLQPWAALHLMGITEDQFPDEMIARGLYRPEATMVVSATGVVENTGDDVNEIEDETETAVRSLDEEPGRFRRWYKKRLGHDVDHFDSDTMTKAHKLLIADEMLRKAAAWEDYP